VPEMRMVDNELVVAALDSHGRSDLHAAALQLRSSPRHLQTCRKSLSISFEIVSFFSSGAPSSKSLV
jgi:hypothetical protein